MAIEQKNTTRSPESQPSRLIWSRTRPRCTHDNAFPQKKFLKRGIRMRRCLWPGDALSPLQPHACGRKMWYADVLMTGIRRLVAKRTEDSECEQVYHREESPSPCLCRQTRDMG